MREIKFRFYSQNGETGMWSISEQTLEDIENQDSWQGRTGNWQRIAVCQYTGLKDKNGKEIWEGDIVKESRDNGKGLIPYTVAWNVEAGGFTIKTSEDKEMDGSLWLLTRVNWENFEVIGNIYEDSNLLESEVVK